MAQDHRLLTIQDISCVGQCSLTVALPIVSACGIETAILPSSVLSNHTGKGFGAWTFRDLTDEMPKILDQWLKEKIDFDAFYTGYVSKAQIPHILDIFQKAARPGAVKIVDPAMADNGKLYAGFDADFPKEMARLVAVSDYALPNLTEASFLLGQEYIESGYDKAYIEKTIVGLHKLGAKNVILTGVSFEPSKLGVAVSDGSRIDYYFNERLPAAMHGTGDVYASAFAGALLRGKPVLDAAAIAADFVLESMKKTLGDDSHFYGVKFEKAIPFLVNRLEK
ncbi:MAG: pyridoxamine kinase [Treponema sp.]|nr:pyridoxamine kinase [Treponema sp.]